MFGKDKKKTLGMKAPEAPQKTREQINQEYSEMATQVGHQLSLAKAAELAAERAHEFIRGSLATMMDLRKQSDRLPPSPQPQPESAKAPE